jgi:dTDP-4-amino-4,6-dideoxygalactose transaminase
VARPALPPLELYVRALEGIWDRGMLSNDGPCAREFEDRFADYGRGCGHVLAASSADLGLTLAIAALDLPRGSRGVLASFGFPSSIHALEWNGLRPHFVDVGAGDWCLHADRLDGQLDGASVIVATHLFGVPCDVAGLETLAEERGIAVVFDAAQAAGTWVGDRHVAAYGDASVISFGGTKVVTAAEGALVALRSERVAERFRRLRRYGIGAEGESDLCGLNAKLSELHAALALLTMHELEQQIELRAALATLYRQRFAQRDDISLQQIPPGCRPTPAFFVADFGDARDRVREALAASGIESRPYFPPLHLMPRFAHASRSALPVTERLGRGLLALPLYSELDPGVVDEVCDLAGCALDDLQTVDG